MIPLRDRTKRVLIRLGLIQAPSSRPGHIEWLKSQGCQIGERLKLIGNAKIDENHCWHISIGDDVTMAPGSYILAHDASTKTALGYTRLASVSIGDRVFLGAHVLILPGVTIGSDCIVGAGAVVTKSFESGSVVAGNPARKISTVDAFLEKRSEDMKKSPCFDESYTIEGGLDEGRKSKLKDAVRAGEAYLR